MYSRFVMCCFRVLIACNPCMELSIKKASKAILSLGISFMCLKKITILQLISMQSGSLPSSALHIRLLTDQFIPRICLMKSR